MCVALQVCTIDDVICKQTGHSLVLRSVQVWPLPQSLQRQTIFFPPLKAHFSTCFLCHLKQTFWTVSGHSVDKFSLKLHQFIRTQHFWVQIYGASRTGDNTTLPPISQIHAKLLCNIFIKLLEDDHESPNYAAVGPLVSFHTHTDPTFLLWLCGQTSSFWNKNITDILHLFVAWPCWK